jgi:hypothetical protein
MKRTGAAITVVVAAVLAAGCGTNSSNPPTSSPRSATPNTSASSIRPAQTPSSSAPSPTKATSAPTPTTKLVFYRIAYQWAWPGPMSADTAVRHTPKVPPEPELVGISVGQHLVTAGLPYDRMSFTFANAYPSSHFWYSDTLLAVSTGKVIPKPSYGQPNCAWLGISFTVAQAHTSTGASSIVSQPPPFIGEQRIVSYVQAGDVEGGLNYGIIVSWPTAHSNPQIPVRVVEVETVTPAGQHLYTVAFDVDASNHG